MGIDVEIGIGLKKELPNSEFIRVKNLLNECSPVDGELTYGCYTENENDFKTLLGISSCTRYYGEGYERGPYLSIYGLLSFLREVFVNYEPTIFYSGDCNPNLSEFTLEEQNELLKHFCKVGESPYRRTDYTIEIKN